MSLSSRKKQPDQPPSSLEQTPFKFPMSLTKTRDLARQLHQEKIALLAEKTKLEIQLAEQKKADEDRLTAIESRLRNEIGSTLAVAHSLDFAREKIKSLQDEKDFLLAETSQLQSQLSQKESGAQNWKTSTQTMTTHFKKAQFRNDKLEQELKRLQEEAKLREEELIGTQQRLDFQCRLTDDREHELKKLRAEAKLHEEELIGTQRRLDFQCRLTDDKEHELKKLQAEAKLHDARLIQERLEFQRKIDNYRESAGEMADLVISLRQRKEPSIKVPMAATTATQTETHSPVESFMRAAQPESQSSMETTMTENKAEPGLAGESVTSVVQAEAQSSGDLVTSIASQNEPSSLVKSMASAEIKDEPSSDELVIVSPKAANATPKILSVQVIAEKPLAEETKSDTAPVVISSAPSLDSKIDTSEKSKFADLPKQETNNATSGVAIASHPSVSEESYFAGIARTLTFGFIDLRSTVNTSIATQTPTAIAPTQPARLDR